MAVARGGRTKAKSTVLTLVDIGRLAGRSPFSTILKTDAVQALRLSDQAIAINDYIYQYI